MKDLFSEATPDDTLEEQHGPLIEFTLSHTTHGMAMGSGSYSSESLNWNRDGSITLTYTSSGGGMSLRNEYNVKPEIARKMRDYVAEKHLAELSKQKIPTSMFADNFTSTGFTMTFDDSEIGGSPYVRRNVQCGPAGMTFRTIENELSAILKECRETGEYVSGESKKVDILSGLFGGLNGIATPSESPKVSCWTCSNCGYDKNSGKFCVECGSRR